MSSEAAASASPKRPLAEVLGDANFRNYWVASTLAYGATGTVRFAFVWLMVTLTDWPAAEGRVGIALGIPAVLLSVIAGAWSDRVDRKVFFQTWTAIVGVCYAGFAVIVALGWVSPISAGVAAFIIGCASSFIGPNASAIAPLLVPPERLMNAVALQNGASQAAGFLGLVLCGGLIQLFGIAAGFGLLAVLCFSASMFMTPVIIPEVPRTDDATLGSEIAAGLRYGLGSEPRRSLLVAALILGASFAVMQFALPRVVETDYGKGSLAAGALLGTFGLGMLTSSFLVARLENMRHGMNVAIFIGIGLGLGQFLLSFAPNYWVAMAVLVGWGLNAGIAIASHRTLLQRATEPEMMGRVMGIMLLGFAGGLPFGAFAQSILAPAYGPVNTMRIVGLATMGLTIPLLWRRVIRDAR